MAHADDFILLRHRHPHVFPRPRPTALHAIYGEHEAFVVIETGEILAGYLPKTAARLVAEWALARRMELRANWDRAQRSQPLERLAGLQDE